MDLLHKKHHKKHKKGHCKHGRVKSGERKGRCRLHRKRRS